MAAEARRRHQPPALSPEAPRAVFHTPTQLSEHIRATPEGFLLCRSVAIARTGIQSYAPGEVPVEDDGSGVIRVERPEAEVFRAETMTSFAGKPVTLGHPEEFVGPENWKRLAVGIVQNVRRGEGDHADCVLADLLITDEQAIALVSNGLRQVSCGYEADYTQDAPGRAHQTNILGNHVALVEKGRCGGKCSIQDEERSMSKPSAWDRLLQAVGVKSADELKEALTKEPEAAETQDGKTGAGAAGNGKEDRILALLEDIVRRLDNLSAGAEGGKAERSAPEETGRDEGDEPDAADTAKAVTADKAEAGTAGTGGGMGDAKAVLPHAEILAPGVRVRDGDTAATLKRRALTAALEGDHATVISEFMGGKTADRLGADELNATFSAAAQLVRQLNNTQCVRAGVTVKDFGQPTAISDLNAMHRKYWADKGGIQQ